MVKMTSVLLSVLILLGCSRKKENGYSFPVRHFEYVVAYKMNGQYGLVIEDGKVSTKTTGRRERLTDKEEMELLSIFNDPNSSGEIGLMCFEPHVG